MYSSAVRTDCARNRERKLHVGERLLKVGRGNGANQGAALAAADVCPSAADFCIERPAALLIAKRRMGKGSPAHVIRVHDLSVTTCAFSIGTRDKLKELLARAAIPDIQVSFPHLLIDESPILIFCRPLRSVFTQHRAGFVCFGKQHFE